MPSQKQLKWSQLRVGLTVIFASVTLALLLFLMTGTGGLFTKHITLKSYFDNASGIRVGAPVRLSGVDIGNVVKIQIVPDKDKQLTPVEVRMKVSTKYAFNLRRDSVTSLGDDPYVITAGVTDDGGNVPDWSGRESFKGYRKPELLAPGVSVVSVRVAGSTIDRANPEARVGDSWFRGTGTSM